MRIIPNYLLLICIFFISQKSIAQSETNLLIEDMLLVAENFASPGAEGAALQASAGWFSSARSMEPWQVEVSVHANALFVPKNKQNKLSNNNDFSVLSFEGASNALLPTVYGGDTDAVFNGEVFGQQFSFDAIDGLNKKVLVHPFIQATVGLPYGTEFAARYLPSIVVDDVGFSTFGAGIKHNFTQYMKYSKPEDFQFAAAITYSNFKVDYGFEPVDIRIANLSRIDVNADLWLVQLLGSKLYDTFEVFGGVGVTNSDFGYEMGGSGDGLTPLNQALTGLTNNETKFKGDLGFNYYVGKFKISTMFTASSFFNANVGVHYRIR